MSSMADDRPVPHIQTDVLNKSVNSSMGSVSEELRIIGNHASRPLTFENSESAPSDPLDTNLRTPSKPRSQGKDLVAAELEPASPMDQTNTFNPSLPPTPGTSNTGGPTNGASDLYWEKLHSLLEEAHVMSNSLRPNASLIPIEHMGFRGEVALVMQGRSPTECEARLANLSAPQSRDFRSILSSCAAGVFTDYGVENTHVSWVIERLFPQKDVVRTDKDVAVLCDWVRVCVFESEVVCLPVESIDPLLAARKAMRNLRSRIDKCVRIIAAMEGRGRRKAQSALDKLKAALEKAELQARAEQSRARKLNTAEIGRGGKAGDAEPKWNVSSSGGTPSAKRTALEVRRKRELAQKNAQASFMMRFVRGKATGSSSSKDDADRSDRRGGDLDCGDNEERSINDAADRREEGCYAACIADDRDVMSVSWWLRSCMSAIPLKELDNSWNTGANDQKANTFNIAFLKAHLKECSKRREAAQRQVLSVLRNYRRGRKEHIGDRNPCFIHKRSDCRAKCEDKNVKLLHFDENYRPAYYGTWSRVSTAVNGRRPLGKDGCLDYEYDSDEDWDEEEDGENLSDPEADDERAAEDAELRKLYGSDESDDEDFDENGDEEDGRDDFEEDFSETENINEGCVVDGGAEDLCNSQESVEIVGIKKVIDFNATDLEGSHLSNQPNELRSVSRSRTPVSVVENSGGTAAARGGAPSGARGMGGERASGTKRSGKRLKVRATQSVVIEGPCLTVDGQTVRRSSLDQYAVTMLPESGAIEMFNPLVMDTCVMAGEYLKGRSSGLKSSRMGMDQSAKQELALAVEKGSKHSHSRDKIVSEFCQAREAQGHALPSKSEIVRTINEMATFEKREGDTKPCWHLNTPGETTGSD